MSEYLINSALYREFVDDEDIPLPEFDATCNCDADVERILDVHDYWNLDIMPYEFYVYLFESESDIIYHKIEEYPEKEVELRKFVFVCITECCRHTNNLTSFHSSE